MPALSPVTLVVGATGKQDSAVVRAIWALSHPYQIRALSCDPSSPAAQKLEDPGVEVVQGDLTDSVRLDEALVGLGYAVLITTISTMGQPTKDQHSKNFTSTFKLDSDHRTPQRKLSTLRPS
ncbi:hypothetical protein Rt10032_c21g6489 [Rhodotorula toruloides]|uniref:NmrA-like domain-containing protein n=1 Tax=Rhodotorula toruloides TaxID=5286 RepID=A0A511KQ30_RHOTO|nr:hypothetical protein Rt10032_c21g6489 [Rhodotorula toruloides]